MKNARSFEQQGAARVLENKYIKDELITLIKELLQNKQEQNDIARAVAGLGRPDAGKAIASVAIELLEDK